MKNAFVRVFESKKPELKGKKFYALVVKFGDKFEKLFFDKREAFMELLDCTPSKLASLDCGDYEIM